MANDDRRLESHGKASLWVALAGLALIVVPVLMLLVEFGRDAYQWIWTKEAGDLLIGKFQVVVGLPAAAVLAFVVVTLLRQTAGPIELEGFGFKFRRAAGQAILWIACFLAIAASIKWLW